MTTAGVAQSFKIDLFLKESIKGNRLTHTLSSYIGMKNLTSNNDKILHGGGGYGCLELRSRIMNLLNMP